jgi:hypothetical protein
MTKRLRTAVLTAMLCASLFTSAQSDKQAKPGGESSPAHEAANSGPTMFYRLDYLLREMDGTKEISKRNYAITIKSGRDYKSLRTGSRVPVVTGEPASGRSQWQYMDVGINIDSETNNYANGVWLNVTAELSSIAPSEGSQATPSLPPLVRQAKVTGSVPLITGKSQLVFSADEPTSSHRFELTVTPTLIK